MMHKNWQVTKQHCHNNPIPHIYCKGFTKLDLYDRLYEQWNNKEHERWKTFIDQNNINIHFHDDFVKSLIPKRTTGYIGYWFFKQRTDKSSKGDIHISNGREQKILTYYQNTILILDTHSTFVVKSRKDQLPYRPFCELYFDETTNEKIKNLLN